MSKPGSNKFTLGLNKAFSKAKQTSTTNSTAAAVPQSTFKSAFDDDDDDDDEEDESSDEDNNNNSKTQEPKTNTNTNSTPFTTQPVQKHTDSNSNDDNIFGMPVVTTKTSSVTSFLGLNKQTSTQTSINQFKATNLPPQRPMIPQPSSDDSKMFAYDEVYDEIVEDRKKIQSIFQQQKDEKNDMTKESELMKDLIERSELRKKERELMRDRVKLREQLREEEVSGPMQKFVTSAFKKKIEEDKIWEEKLRLQDEEINKTAVNTSKYSMAKLAVNDKSNIPEKDENMNTSSKYVHPTKQSRMFENETDNISTKDSSYREDKKIKLTQTTSIDEDRFLRAYKGDDTHQPTSGSNVEKTETLSELEKLIEEGKVSLHVPQVELTKDDREKRAQMMRERALARQKAKQL